MDSCCVPVTLALKRNINTHLSPKSQHSTVFKEQTFTAPRVTHPAESCQSSACHQCPSLASHPFSMYHRHLLRVNCLLSFCPFHPAFLQASCLSLLSYFCLCTAEPGAWHGSASPRPSRGSSTFPHTACHLVMEGRRAQPRIPLKPAALFQLSPSQTPKEPFRRPRKY